MDRSVRRRETGLPQGGQELLFPRLVGSTLQVSLYVNQDVYNQLPKHYQAALAQAAAAATNDMIAKYDAENPAALRRLVAEGAQLKAFPKSVMEACYTRPRRSTRSSPRRTRCSSASTTAWWLSATMRSPGSAWPKAATTGSCDGGAGQITPFRRDAGRPDRHRI